MTDDLMRMASFRIDRELWAKFGAIAKRERLTVTDVLTDYIQRCTDNDRTEYAVNTNNDISVINHHYDNDKLDDDVITAINTRIDEVVSSIDDRIANLNIPTYAVPDAIIRDLDTRLNDVQIKQLHLDPKLNSLVRSQAAVEAKLLHQDELKNDVKALKSRVDDVEDYSRSEIAELKKPLAIG